MFKLRFISWTCSEPQANIRTYKFQKVLALISLQALSAANFRFSGKLLISAACMAKYRKLCIFEALVAFVFLTKLDWNRACTAPHAYHRISHPHQFAALPLLFLAGARSDGQRASNQLEGVISNSGSRQKHRDLAKCTMITPNAWRLCQMRCSIGLLCLLNAKLT